MPMQRWLAMFVRTMRKTEKQWDADTEMITEIGSRQKTQEKESVCICRCACAYMHYLPFHFLHLLGLQLCLWQDVDGPITITGGQVGGVRLSQPRGRGDRAGTSSLRNLSTCAKVMPACSHFTRQNQWVTILGKQFTLKLPLSWSCGSWRWKLIDLFQFNTLYLVYLRRSN